jgi:hypothetical protein
LYLLDEKNEATNLMNSDQGYISSVSWMPGSHVIAVGMSDSNVFFILNTIFH